MNLARFVRPLDNLQRKHHAIGFPIAVVKRYGEGNTGFQAALLTYYAYLSLFPLLLVLVTVTQLIAGSRPQLQERVISATASYFPLLGDQLASHVNSLHKSGLALVVGLVFLFYGARGVAAAFRYAVLSTWGIPRGHYGNFAESTGRQLVIIITGGIGFLLAAALTAVVAAAGADPIFRASSVLINVGVLYLTFIALLKLSLPWRTTLKDIRLAAVSAAVGLVILQLAGGYILARVLKNLDALYSYFALSLGLLFWLYLQAQVICYAVVAAVVRHKKLWPRSLAGEMPTSADTRVKQLA